MATDGVHSCAIFTYRCGELNWIANDYASIGFSITESYYGNHELSLTSDVNNIACTYGNWSNVNYKVGHASMCNTHIIVMI